MRTIDYDNTDSIREAILAADNINNKILADTLQILLDVITERDALQEQIYDIETLAQWDFAHGPAQEYHDFFFECFTRLNGHYPCPSVTSDYDKGLIFELIERGENCQHCEEE